MSSTPSGLHLHYYAGHLPTTARSKPLYGNITGVSMDLTYCEITTYPSSTAQKKKQKLSLYTFDLSLLPVNHQSRSLYRAIEAWLQDRDVVPPGRGNDETAELKDIGPRVTFFDYDTLAHIPGYSRLFPQPPPISGLGQVPGQGQDYQPNAMTRSASSSSSMTMTRSRSKDSVASALAKSGAYDNPGRACDVGLVWWLADHHGRYL